ncbi:hypothetical protein SCFA_20009 [anaerobic digester metagenome]|uniref:Uncharacterized protein n=1 Tax=anaerobic digester metagenome TaxID=1263854 RepID=A0A485LX04_9ZZZZ
MESAYNDEMDKNPGLTEDSFYQVENGKMLLEDIVNVGVCP